MHKRKNAVFLDKDGTIIKDIPYNIDQKKVLFMNDLFSSLRFLQQLHYLIVIVSNQPGVAKGLFTSDDVDHLGHFLEQEFKKQGVLLNGLYYCPHNDHSSPATDKPPCICRKPREGLLIKAASELSIELKNSWMIGDILNDVEAGNRAGCRTILIDNGNETEWEMTHLRTPEFFAVNLSDAVNYIGNNY